MGQHLASERAAARAAVVKATGRAWWTLITYTHPAAGRVIHVGFMNGEGQPQRSGVAYLYAVDTGVITECDGKLSPLAALGVDL